MRINHYSDIDEMPVFNWFKINSTQDMSWMLPRRKKLSDKETEFLSKKFNGLYDQYIATFGFNETFMEILKKKKQIAQMIVKKIEKNDSGMNTLIKIQQAKLQEMQEQMPATSTFYEIKDYVENKAGFQIDVHKMSVTEFYTKLQTINNNG